jgi:hypothetical protein
MLKLCLFLAQATPEIDDIETLRKSAKTGGNPLANTDLTIILGCVLALAALLFFWAYFMRKRPKHVRGALVVTRVRKGDNAEADPGNKRRRRRRADHPENWKRNPTLGETGGLPPVRAEDTENANAPDLEPPGESARQSVQPR